MSKPRLLDLFCCAGGAAVGYERAGFDVYGVDLSPQPNYPFKFVQGDAIQVLEKWGWWFDAVHASPPCQRYSAGTRAVDRERHPDLVAPTRNALVELGKPWVIENVVGAPLRDPVMLCGRQFDLTATDTDGVELHLDRHRMFETPWNLKAPKTCLPHDRSLQVAGSYGGARRDKDEARFVRKGGYVPSFSIQQQLLGIEWMKEKEMYQALPPAYTEYIGKQLIQYV
jgi:DNA (cytosine-5)-methyltransferase 1